MIQRCGTEDDSFATVTAMNGDTIVTTTATEATAGDDNVVGEVIAAIKQGEDVLEADTDNFKDHSLLRQLWSP